MRGVGGQTLENGGQKKYYHPSLCTAIHRKQVAQEPIVAARAVTFRFGIFIATKVQFFSNIVKRLIGFFRAAEDPGIYPGEHVAREIEGPCRGWAGRCFCRDRGACA